LTAAAKYIIGIDLGTTNSVVAYAAIADLEERRPAPIRIFRIPQRVDAASIEKRDILPSFILVPASRAQKPQGMPWDPECQTVVGEFARDRGSEVPAQLISSAKSWLCHDMVDRNKAILPWQAPAEIRKYSPVQASAMILEHIRNAWNHEMADDTKTGGASVRMQDQEIYLTVPASFDPVARDLTVKAARLAGLSQVTLIEEPQAVFYAWIASSHDRWRDRVRPGDIVLVCDIGGGTTDFSLIRIADENGRMALERIAVGDHLLVGGDNMDLALAYSVARRIADEGTRLDSWQMRCLWHSCRKVKERLLSGHAEDRYPVTILGRGSRLIGGTIRSYISSSEIKRVIIDGFFPRCAGDAGPTTRPSAGIRELGLAYASDPAVTHHLAAFLGRHLGRVDSGAGAPSAVLFNGGVMKPGRLRSRILDIMRTWWPADETDGLREIEAQNMDLAVARGAVYYGLARRGKGIRIRSGLAKSYYVGIAASLPAVPGMPAPTKALCVAPFGMQEGSETVFPNREFVLAVGEPVRFDFLGSATRQKDTAGEIIEDWQGDLDAVTTIETVLDGESGTQVPVMLEARVTEVGTLELWCVSRQDGRRWKLEFNVREAAG